MPVIAPESSRTAGVALQRTIDDRRTTGGRLPRTGTDADEP
jgi:hypothetical protein